MAGTVVTADELDALAKHIADINAQAQGHLRQVRNAAETVAGSWQGMAASAFQQLIGRFDDDARKISDALQGICESIASTSDVYRQNEEEQAQSVSKVQNLLG